MKINVSQLILSTMTRRVYYYSIEYIKRNEPGPIPNPQVFHKRQYDPLFLVHNGNEGSVV